MRARWVEMFASGDRPAAATRFDWHRYRWFPLLGKARILSDDASMAVINGGPITGPSRTLGQLSLLKSFHLGVREVSILPPLPSLSSMGPSSVQVTGMIAFHHHNVGLHGSDHIRL